MPEINKFEDIKLNYFSVLKNQSNVELKGSEVLMREIADKFNECAFKHGFSAAVTGFIAVLASVVIAEFIRDPMAGNQKHAFETVIMAALVFINDISAKHKDAIIEDKNAYIKRYARLFNTTELINERKN